MLGVHKAGFRREGHIYCFPVERLVEYIVVDWELFKMYFSKKDRKKQVIVCFKKKTEEKKCAAARRATLLATRWEKNMFFFIGQPNLTTSFDWSIR